MQCIGVCSADGGGEVSERDIASAVAVFLVDSTEGQVTNGEHVLVAARSPHGQVKTHAEVLPCQSGLGGPSRGNV